MQIWSAYYALKNEKGRCPMKKTKSLLSLLLSLSLLFSAFSLTAYATGEEPSPEVTPPSEQEENVSPVEVTNLEELQSAIEVAEDGDSIVLCNHIDISENCIVGHSDKTLTLIPKDTFEFGAFLNVNGIDCPDVTIQNLILDGKRTELSAITVNNNADGTSNGEVNISNVTVKNFQSDSTVVAVYISTVIFEKCVFTDNSARRSAGIEISPDGEAVIKNCVFKGNSSLSNGGAISCRGTTKIIDTEITDNIADNDSARNGGGIAIDNGAYCEIVGCKIINNIADLGGGIRVNGVVSVLDTLLYGNTGNLGASDIYAFANSKITLSYSSDINSVYTEENPVGFYKDYFEEPFDANNTVFLGESLNIDSTENRFGTKFVFAADLPTEDTPSTETPEESTTPDTSETPTEPEEPNAPDSSDETQETETPSNPSLPSEPDITDTPDEPKEPENTPAPSRPFFPIHIILSLMKQKEEAAKNVPPVEQEEESKKEEAEKLELSHGGAILDTSIPLVLLGYGDGQPHENDPITRAQIAVLLYRSLTDESKATLTASTNFFADVKSGEWYCDAVSALSSAGIINGCDGLFSPNDNLTWGQLIALLTRFVEPKTAIMPEDFAYYEHWAYNNIVTAVAYGWIDNAVTIAPDHFVTRGEAVAFVNSIFEICGNPI